MLFLKNINKKTIFFFALFAFFIFFPFQKADAYCGDGAVEPVQGEECDSGQALPNFRIEDANQCILNYTRDCQSDCTASFGFICKDAPYPGVNCAGGLEYSLQICEPRCGNGVLEPAYERCDEGALNGVVCTPNPTYSNPPTTCQYCDSACREPITVTGNYCGDNIIDLAQGESCDGSNLNGQTCTTQGFTSGTLVCNATCNAFDTTSCYRCGDGSINTGEQCDNGALKNIREISAGFNNSCAYDTGGAAYCWGNNGNGQLGDNTTAPKSTPVQVKGAGGAGNLTNITGITSGVNNTCAYDTGGAAYCWGANFDGKLGDGTTASKYTPVQVKGAGGAGFLTNVAGITPDTYYHNCAYTTGGVAYCWGNNYFGQLGDGTTASKYTPVQVKGAGGAGFLTNVAGLTSGESHSCVYTADGAAYCWGWNISGQLGDNTTTNKSTPVQVKGAGGAGNLTNIADISAGFRYTCALDTSRNVYCWGNNMFSQLGNGTNTFDNFTYTPPVQVLGVGGAGNLTNIVKISAGGYHTCALDATYNVYCWGNNGNGQLGDGTFTKKNTPVKVLGITGAVVGISTGYNHSCAYDTDGAAYCWGNNDNGQLGDGTFTQKNTAVKVNSPEKTQSCVTPPIGAGNHTYPGAEICSASCTLNACATSLFCGDSIKNGSEQCDGAFTDTCLSIPGGYTGGTLSCDTTNCNFNTSQCYVCGDGVINSLETCDQGSGNVANGDGCNSTCQVENGYSCTGAPSVCALNCGNGNLDAGEICDPNNAGSKTLACVDANSYNGAQTCLANCSGYGACVATESCGDSILNGTETCDDGNVTNNDGCNNTCQVENGYSCTGAPSICAPNCGNGDIDAGEICDPNNAGSKTLACVDANSYNGAQTCLANCSGYGACVATESCGDSIKNGNELCDTSTNTCAINSYQGTQNCVMTGANPCKSFAACVPTESCGDSVLNGTETCDQGSGNVANGDGCNSTCQVENGYSCTGAPSVCALNCGNGNIDAGETCDPSHTGTATASCTTATGYPGTQSCLLNCTGYGACASTLSCGDGIFTNPPETCDGDTRSCTTSAGGYQGTQNCAETCDTYGTCNPTERCGDGILNGDEECDYDAGTTKVNGDGCSTDCKVEEGFTCYNDPNTTPPNKNVCVFSCGNEILQSVAPFNEECDYGAAPVDPPQLGDRGGAVHGPYNGDICTPTYGVPCAWCSTDCKNQIVLGEYCGDSRVNGTEYCDDGNFNNGDGCSACEDGGDFGSETKDGNIGCANGCKKEFGFVCEGFPFSTCKTQCGDGQCAGGTAETCVNCPGDCGMCSIGQRPGVSAVHDRGVFTSLFDKIKTFIFQPQPVIQIPGMNLGQTKINEEFILPPPPIEKDYEIGQPTMTKIGDEYYTITVQTVGDDGSLSFTIK